MSLAPWKIIAVMGLVPVAGIGIAYPLISVYKSNTRIELKNLKDFKRHCLAVVKEDNKQLLTCPVTNSSSDTDFYFYEKEIQEQLPQKIKKIEVNKERLTLTILDNRKFTINNSKLNFLTNKDLLKECKINWQKKEGEEKVLTCSNQANSLKLEKFE